MYLLQFRTRRTKTQTRDRASSDRHVPAFLHDCLSGSARQLIVLKQREDGRNFFRCFYDDSLSRMNAVLPLIVTTCSLSCLALVTAVHDVCILPLVYATARRHASLRVATFRMVLSSCKCAARIRCPQEILSLVDGILLAIASRGCLHQTTGGSPIGHRPVPRAPSTLGGCGSPDAASLSSGPQRRRAAAAAAGVEQGDAL
jgi:hypothetical protein